jgi:hypothetical protein
MEKVELMRTLMEYAIGIGSGIIIAPMIIWVADKIANY